PYTSGCRNWPHRAPGPDAVLPMATCLNSSGDTVASMMISRMVEGKGWMDKKSERKTDPEKAAIAAQIGGCGCGTKE
ncbi:MAG: hypothetical protein SOT33_04720, partial [Acidaminococcus fermentans]